MERSRRRDDEWWGEESRCSHCERRGRTKHKAALVALKALLLFAALWCVLGSHLLYGIMYIGYFWLHSLAFTSKVSLPKEKETFLKAHSLGAGIRRDNMMNTFEKKVLTSDWHFQFNSVYFVKPIITNDNLPSDGFTVCTHRHPWPLTFDLISDQEQLPKNRKKPSRGKKESNRGGSLSRMLLFHMTIGVMWPEGIITELKHIQWKWQKCLNN